MIWGEKGWKTEVKFKSRHLVQLWVERVRFDVDHIDPVRTKGRNDQPKINLAPTEFETWYLVSCLSFLVVGCGLQKKESPAPGSGGVVVAAATGVPSKAEDKLSLKRILHGCNMVIE